MKNVLRGLLIAGVGWCWMTQLGGCPAATSPLSYVAGGTGESGFLRAQASVTVLTPVSDLSIKGGTPVEVNWQAFASSRFSTLNVIIDTDQNPRNGNETIAYSNLALTESKALVDTTRLSQATYYLGVVMVETSGAVVTYDYAPGTITVDERPSLFFNSPRGNFTYDRSDRINPSFTVSWSVSDPDSTNEVLVYLGRLIITLDSGDRSLEPGTEILLYRSQSQTGDSFSFDLPTAGFEAGTYGLMAVVTDGRGTDTFVAPGGIRLRGRLSGPVDLRDLGMPGAEVEGAIFEGFNPRDNAGSFVSSAEDVDGDGFDDILIVSQFGKPEYDINLQRRGVGEAYLIYGRQTPFSGVVNLNSTGTLLRGEIYGGAPEVPDPIRPSRGITSFAVVSDWDGDGVRDIAFGMPFTDSATSALLDQAGYFRTGAVVIVSSSILLNFAGQHYFPLGEIAVEIVPPAVSPGNPPCPEGFIGPKSPAQAGGSTQFYQAWGTTVRASRLGARFSTAVFGDQCGETLSAYPVADIPAERALIISVPGRDPRTCCRLTSSLPGAGVVSVYYHPVGRNPWDGTAIDVPRQGPYLSVLDDREWSPGWVKIEGNPCQEVFLPDIETVQPQRSRTARLYGGIAGAAVSGAMAVPDFSADGIPDIIVGSPLSNNGAGSAFIVLGRISDLVRGTELNLEELGRPMNSFGTPRAFDGIRVVGAPGDRLGQSQASAGDFNADGISDVVIGSPLINNRRGGAAVFYGSRTVINLTETEIPFGEIPSRGLGVIFIGEAEDDFAGARVAGAGDVDGDGNDDILIAAPNRSVRLDLNGDGVLDIDRTHCGAVYLVYGAPDLNARRTPGGQTGVLELKYVATEELPGAVFIGRNTGDQLGAGIGEQGDRSWGIAGAGDVDSDGRRDIMLSSVTAAPRDRARAGEVYLLYASGD